MAHIAFVTKYCGRIDDVIDLHDIKRHLNEYSDIFMVGQIFQWHCFVSAQLRVFKAYFVLCIVFIHSYQAELVFICCVNIHR